MEMHRTFGPGMRSKLRTTSKRHCHKGDSTNRFSGRWLVHFRAKGGPRASFAAGKLSTKALIGFKLFVYDSSCLVS